MVKFERTLEICKLNHIKSFPILFSSPWLQVSARKSSFRSSLQLHFTLFINVQSRSIWCFFSLNCAAPFFGIIYQTGLHTVLTVQSFSRHCISALEYCCLGSLLKVVVMLRNDLSTPNDFDNWALDGDRQSSNSYFRALCWTDIAILPIKVSGPFKGGGKKFAFFRHLGQIVNGGFQCDRMSPLFPSYGRFRQLYFAASAFIQPVGHWLIPDTRTHWTPLTVYVSLLSKTGVADWMSNYWKA